MKVTEILENICSTRGNIAKSEILREHSGNIILREVLKNGLNSFTPFYVVKVPKVLDTERRPGMYEKDRWGFFFDVAQICSSRSHTGNAAIELMHTVFSSVTEAEEKWMRKILKKKLTLGIGAKTINKVYPDLIPTFEVSLAQQFQEKRIKDMPYVFVEPKLDGIRCFAVVENGDVLMFARSGKLITNFDNTIGHELSHFPDGCYDGELMGEDFVSLMRQAYRKAGVETDNTYLALFDYLTIDEWRSGTATVTCEDRYNTLQRVTKDEFHESSYVKVVERHTVDAHVSCIKELHDKFAAAGYEGAMIKDPCAVYKFGRGYEVMKMKDFHDVDLVIDGLDEGTGKHKGRLGAVVVDYKGTEVKVGSGFSDELREQVWNDPVGFIGRMIEVRYQEVTPDGSLRFPTFVCFRNDR
jgi:DNA ligase-1